VILPVRFVSAQRPVDGAHARVHAGLIVARAIGGSKQHEHALKALPMDGRQRRDETLVKPLALIVSKS